MTAKLLSGKEISEAIKAEVRSQIAELSFKPCLAVVRVGEDPASAVYVASKVRTSEELGMRSEHIHLSPEISQAELLQLPLPKHIDESAVIEAIDPEKDVDGFHPVNVGRLSLGQDSLVPCTPAGVIEILRRSAIEITGK